MIKGYKWRYPLIYKVLHYLLKPQEHTLHHLRPFPLSMDLPRL